MIERLQANPDILRFHVPTDAKEPAFPEASAGAPAWASEEAKITTKNRNRPNLRPGRLRPYITS
jgi:hypothetical protein